METAAARVPPPTPQPSRRRRRTGLSASAPAETSFLDKVFSAFTPVRTRIDRDNSRRIARRSPRLAAAAAAATEAGTDASPRKRRRLSAVPRL